MVVEQPTTRDHEGGGVVVELTQAVGGLGDQEPVVAAVPGDGPESFERLHSSQPTGRRAGRWERSCRAESCRAHRREGPLERREELGVPGQQLGTTAQLERAPGERVLRPHRALVQCPRGGGIGGQHDVGLAGTRLADTRPVTVAPSVPKCTR